MKALLLLLQAQHWYEVKSSKKSISGNAKSDKFPREV
uniref:Protein MON2 homolog isoform X2 n=1 Tax=Rhizophora mucronata TaxID=61149 RepID=A0A2P2MTS5_RHIMU